jgi:S-layer homology domain.
MRIFRIVLLISVLYAVIQPTLFAAEGDQPSSWAKREVQSAINKGLVPVRLQWKYQEPITREEFAQLLVQTIIAKHNAENRDVSPWTIEELLRRATPINQFEDTNADYVQAAFVLGSINGVSETKFDPHRPITRQEAATMLMNTVHYSSGITYDNKIKKAYSDFNKIADWAQPAVLASGSLKLMQGVGKSFDYLGKFTREQSIATMIRLYDSIDYKTLTVRGHIPIYSDNKTIKYVVGKSYVAVYSPVKFEDSEVDPVMNRAKRDWIKANGGNPTDVQAGIAYLFKDLRTNIPEMIESAVKNESVVMDYGYMVVSTLSNQYMLEFSLKPNSGYMTIKNGYTYGYPKVNVQPKKFIIPAEVASRQG